MRKMLEFTLFIFLLGALAAVMLSCNGKPHEPPKKITAIKVDGNVYDVVASPGQKMTVYISWPPDTGKTPMPTWPPDTITFTAIDSLP